ncbi:hypothetical protein [Xanthobacter sp. 126]|uniref:hypothetical protein n=1 Tax=Xanthobacter sp. 126 TaxID=1131814 RepID=UPI00045E5C33|nr:hypothetical protein [Xanthobacter sp. 126]
MSSREPAAHRDGSSPVRPQQSSYRLAVAAEPETNLLLRLLEPFVIHDVLPSRVDCRTDADTLSVTIAFAAEEAVAVRLGQRLGVMVGVRTADLTTAEETAQMRAA